jgi:hypothetical protein
MLVQCHACFNAPHLHLTTHTLANFPKFFLSHFSQFIKKYSFFSLVSIYYIFLFNSETRKNGEKSAKMRNIQRESNVTESWQKCERGCKNRFALPSPLASLSSLIAHQEIWPKKKTYLIDD